MAELRDDILKEEEQFGGFNPGEPDDDSFSIQDKTYPGNIFLFLNPLKPEPDNVGVLQDEPSIDLTDDAIIDDTEEDLFEFEKQKLHKKEVETVDELDDPNFIGYIQGLASVSRMKSKKTSDTDIQAEEVEARPFDPIDYNDNETNVIISDLNLDKPSTAAIEDMNFIPKSPPPSVTNVQNINNQNIPNDDARIKDDEEKEKKRIGISPIIAVAAILLLIASALLYFIPEKPFGIFLSDKSSKDSTIIKISSDKSSKSESNSVVSKESSVKKDSLLSAAKEADKKAANDSLASAITKDVADNISKENTINAEKRLKAEVAEKPIAKIAESFATSTEKKPQVKSAPAKVKVAPTKVSIAKKDIAKTYTKDSKPEDTDAIRETAINETFVPTDIPGVYIVQIYSSPSKEDANKWLNKLKSKSVPDAFISEQNVRDKTWYRVRFGNFRTREEAKNAALRYGFAQTWIDRVK